MKTWIQPLVYLIVVTICGLTVAASIDCHWLSTRFGHSSKTCEDRADRSLAILLGMLGTILALRTPTMEDENMRERILDEHLTRTEDAMRSTLTSTVASPPPEPKKRKTTRRPRRSKVESVDGPQSTSPIRRDSASQPPVVPLYKTSDDLSPC